MSIHRYVWNSVNLAQLVQVLPPSAVPTIVGAGPKRAVDINLADDNAKPDLDDAMAELGWAFVQSNPTTPCAPIVQMLLPEEAQFLATLFPEYAKVNGTSFPVSGLKYDPLVDEAAFWKIDVQLYGSGNIFVDVLWYADTSSTLGEIVRWGAALAAITPDADTQDIETKALAPEITVDDSHLGAVGQRLHKATIVLTGASLDGIAGADAAWLRIRRIGSVDTLTGDAVLERAVVYFEGP